MSGNHQPGQVLRGSATFTPEILDAIYRATDTGVYEIRGFGAKRQLPSFDDLIFLGASMSRYPLEGYREKCETKTVIWPAAATHPTTLPRRPALTKKATDQGHRDIAESSHHGGGVVHSRHRKHSSRDPVRNCDRLRDGRFTRVAAGQADRENARRVRP